MPEGLGRSVNDEQVSAARGLTLRMGCDAKEARYSRCRALPRTVKPSKPVSNAGGNGITHQCETSAK